MRFEFRVVCAARSRHCLNLPWLGQFICAVKVVSHLLLLDTAYHEAHKPEELSSTLDRGVTAVDNIVNYGFIK